MQEAGTDSSAGINASAAEPEAAQQDEEFPENVKMKGKKFENGTQKVNTGRRGKS
jgi:hypothetical protein